MIENIQERANVSGRVDRAGGIIRGVKILGRASRNGRTYTEAAMREAVPLYEGAKVNVNHPPKNDLNRARDYQDRLGVLRSVSAKADGLYGDLHYNPKHALAEQLAWDAENQPDAAGLSHNVEARTSRRDGQTIIEAILKVTSVDLVTDPATVGSLFESGAIVEHVPADTRSYAERLRHPDGLSPERIISIAERYTGRWSKSRATSSVTAHAANRSRTPAETAAKYRSL